MSSFKKKLFEKTTAPSTALTGAPDEEKRTSTTHAPRTSPGRLLDAQIRIGDADAKREAAEVALKAAQQRITELENAPNQNAAEVEISTLVEVPGRRRKLTREEYDELTENLRVNPLIQPIVYRDLGDGRREIIGGHNRVAIYRDELGRKTIKGVPFVGTDAEAELGAAFTNFLAPSLPDYEKYRQFVRIQSLSGLTQADIIRASGLSQGHVARIFSFANLPDAAKKLIETAPHRLGSNAAQKLSMLTQSGGGDRVVAAIEKLISDEKVTQEQVVQLATEKQKRAATQPAIVTITHGKRKLCDVSVRNGVVGLRFSGKDGGAAAEEWCEKITEFIRANLQTE